MKNNNSDFINDLKVSTPIVKQKIDSTEKEQYTCTKVLQDLDKIYYFLRKFKQQQDYEIADKQDKESDAENSYIDISAAESYYYSCDFELMHVHNDFLDRKIDKNEFNNKSNEIYEKIQTKFW